LEIRSCRIRKDLHFAGFRAPRSVNVNENAVWRNQPKNIVPATIAGDAREEIFQADAGLSGNMGTNRLCFVRRYFTGLGEVVFQKLQIRLIDPVDFPRRSHRVTQSKRRRIRLTGWTPPLAVRQPVPVLVLLDN
jgi:hypothetical protein